jgi:lysozyme family protein
MMSVKAMVLAHILMWEGGLSTDPHDPGGLTKYGISSASYPNVNIRELSREQALAIYEQDFWLGLQLPELHPAVAFVVMDAAINMGPHTAVTLLQKVIGQVHVDGILGPETKMRTHELDPEYIAWEFTALRLWEYSQYRQFNRYGKGWVRRSVAALSQALTLR